MLVNYFPACVSVYLCFAYFCVHIYIVHTCIFMAVAITSKNFWKGHNFNIIFEVPILHITLKLTFYLSSMARFGPLRTEVCTLTSGLPGCYRNQNQKGLRSEHSRLQGMREFNITIEILWPGKWLCAQSSPLSLLLLLLLSFFPSFCIVSTTWSNGSMLALNFTRSRRNPRHKPLKSEEMEHTCTLFENCHEL